MSRGRLVSTRARASRLVIVGPRWLAPGGGQAEHDRGVGGRDSPARAGKDMLDTYKLHGTREGDVVRVVVEMPAEEPWVGLEMDNGPALDLTVTVPAKFRSRSRIRVATCALTGTAALDWWTNPVGSRSATSGCLTSEGWIRRAGHSECARRSDDRGRSGEIDVRDVTGSVSVRDGSGSITARGVGGSVHVLRDGRADPRGGVGGRPDRRAEPEEGE